MQGSMKMHIDEVVQDRTFMTGFRKLYEVLAASWELLDLMLGCITKFALERILEVTNFILKFIINLVLRSLLICIVKRSLINEFKAKIMYKIIDKNVDRVADRIIDKIIDRTIDNVNDQ